RSILFASSCAAVLFGVLAIVALIFLKTDTVGAVPFSDLLRHVDQGEVTRLVVNGDTIEFTVAGGPSFQTVAPANYVTANAAFLPALAKRQVRIDVQSPSGSSIDLASILVGIGLVGMFG